MADKTPNWSVNPVALAELITGEDLTLEKDPGQEGDLARVRAMLEKAFATKLEVTARLESIFESDGKMPALLDVFQQLAGSLSEATAFAKMLQQPLVQKAVELFGEEKIRIVLPYLVPVSDASFAPPGAEIQGAPAVVGKWRPLSAADYVVSNASYLDPRQGFVMDCYLISAMIALAWSWPDKWATRVKNIEETGGFYHYRFYTGTKAVDAKLTQVKPWLPLNKHERLAYARSSTNNAEGWPGMFEKAYLIRELKLSDDPSPSDYQAMKNHLREPQVVCQMLAGGVQNVKGGEGDLPLSDRVRARCGHPDNERGVTMDPTIAWTWTTVKDMGGLSWSRTGLRQEHAYAVLGVMKRAGVDYVVLRDPWGWVNLSEGHARGDPWKPGPGNGAGAETVNLNVYGVFALRAEWFDQCMQWVGWVERAG